MTKTIRQLSVMLVAMLMATAAHAQRPLDFAQKFMTLCSSDTTVRCVTVSPKMIEQMMKQQVEGRDEQMIQAIGKLKSARIVNSNADYYEKAVGLLRKNSKRFQAQEEFRNGQVHGTFYTRKDKKGQTVELVMLRQDEPQDKLTIICLTGNIDEEFLCFLYNNKTSFKD